VSDEVRASARALHWRGSRPPTSHRQHGEEGSSGPGICSVRSRPARGQLKASRRSLPSLSPANGCTVERSRGRTSKQPGYPSPDKNHGRELERAPAHVSCVTQSTDDKSMAGRGWGCGVGPDWRRHDASTEGTARRMSVTRSVLGVSFNVSVLCPSSWHCGEHDRRPRH
jgi:hypothetical protein